MMVVTLVMPSVAKSSLGRLLQFAPALDGIDPAAEIGQHRGLVARTGADLQHLVALVELELLGHEGDDVRLGDGLAAIDRQRDVLIGVVGEGLVDEQLARHPLDGAQHLGVANAATPELHDQPDLVLRGCHGRLTPLGGGIATIRRFLAPSSKLLPPVNSGAQSW